MRYNYCHLIIQEQRRSHSCVWLSPPPWASHIWRIFLAFAFHQHGEQLMRQSQAANRLHGVDLADSLWPQCLGGGGGAYLCSLPRSLDMSLVHNPLDTPLRVFSLLRLHNLFVGRGVGTGSHLGSPCLRSQQLLESRP